jgi:Uma2 family endonuclease
MTAEEFFQLGQEPPTQFLRFAPDLAVEVISPSQRPKGIRAKVQDWFAGGARQVWLVYPVTRNPGSLAGRRKALP